MKLRRQGTVWEGILQIMILTVILVVCQAHKLSFLIGLKYFIFQLFWILIPGEFLLLLFKLQGKNKISIIAMGYSLGVSLLVIEYLIFMNLGIESYSFAVTGIITFISCMALYKKPFLQNDPDDFYTWPFCIILIFIVLLIGLFTVSFVNTIPDHISANAYYVDWPFWAGNNISMSKGFPPQDFRLYGEIFKYHYFSSIIISQTHFITGIDIVVLTFYFSFIIPAIMLVTMAYTLASSLIKNHYLILLSLVLILFTDGSSITYAWHIYFCPFGYDYGYIFGMFSVYILICIVSAVEINYLHILLSMLLIFMTTGCKGPVGVVILMGFAAAAFCKILKKEYKEGIALGFIWLTVFLITFFGFMYGKGISSEAGLRFIGLKGAFRENTRLMYIVGDLINRYGIPFNKGIGMLALFRYIFNANRASMALILVIFAYVVGKVLRKQGDKAAAILLGICLWGIFLTITTRQSGGSEMYFIMSVIPIGIIGGFYILEQLKETKYGMITSVILLSVFVSANLDFYHFAKITYLKSKSGYLCILDRLNKEDYIGYDQEYYVTNSDFEAYDWIKNNTDKDTIVAIDYMIGEDNHSKRMVAGVFSERYIWNDGKYSADEVEVQRRNTIIQDFINGSQDAAEELRRSGVNCFVQDLKMNPNFDLKEEYGQLVFENKSFKIYYLKSEAKAR